jgi:DNA-binding phage protein
MAEAPPPPERTYWERVEFLRRLYKVIDETSVMAVARDTGIAKATLYRWMWGERAPNLHNLRALYAAYPDRFSELKLLMEDE